MTQKEKAKAYDEAVERANELIYVSDKDSLQRKTVEHIFPELKESEDEIRKEMIFYFQEEIPQCSIQEHADKMKEFIAWLEKQGNPTDINPSEFDLRLNKLLKQFETLPKEELANSLSFYLNVVQNDGTYKPDEKQGEHSIYNVPSREVILAIWDLGNEWKELTNGCISTEYGTQLDYIQKHWQESEYYLRAKQGEKKHVDKVEPKFKVGDWITDGEKVWKIGYIEDDMYIEHSGTISAGGAIKSIDKHYHLWTIQDAKDGDVLVNWNNTVFVFDKIEDETVKFHIAYNEKWDAIKTPLTKLSHLGLTEPQFDFHPATKEQRDLLFQKMHESGYEWDADKKKLKKIEQKSAEWSEKDETYSDHVITAIKSYYTDYKGKENPWREELLMWLKSLKDKVQQRQEWSEEDEEHIKRIIEHLEGRKKDLKTQWVAELHNKEIDWLKSLKERYTWKPSDEQMNLLEELVEDNNQRYFYTILRSLYEQLKKLREE